MGHRTCFLNEGSIGTPHIKTGSQYKLQVWLMPGWLAVIIVPLRRSILQAETCQILSLAENSRWSPSVAIILLYTTTYKILQISLSHHRYFHTTSMGWYLSPSKLNLGLHQKCLGGGYTKVSTRTHCYLTKELLPGPPSTDKAGISSPRTTSSQQFHHRQPCLLNK